jgi:tetratricopeptide (TPR) repeat protein
MHEPRDRLLEILERGMDELSRSVHGADCLSDDEVVAVAASGTQLGYAERRRIQDHMSRCADCLSRVAEYWDALGAGEGTLTAAAPDRRVAWWPWPDVTPAAAAALLAVVVVTGALGFLRGEDEGTDRMVAVQGIMTAGYRAGTDVLALGAHAARARMVDAIEHIEVAELDVDVQGDGTDDVTYPCPTRGALSPAEQGMLIEVLEDVPAMKAEYDAYVRFWGRVFRRTDAAVARAGKLPEAIEIHEYLVRTASVADPASSPDHLVALYGLGEFYEMAGRYEAARGVYEELALDRLPRGDPRAAYFAGRAAHALGDRDAALAHYDAALAVDADYGAVIYRKALVLREQGHEDQFRQHLDRAIAVTERADEQARGANPDIPYALAVMEATEGNYSACLDYLERALGSGAHYAYQAEQEPAFQGLPAHHESEFRSLIDRYAEREGTAGSEPNPHYDPWRFNT